MAEVVLVHGAWHGAWCWDGVVAELQRRDISVTAVELPLAGLMADAAAARSAIKAAGPGCVVVGHSYGGAVISAAAADLPASRLVYLAAFLTEADEDVNGFMAGSKLTESLVIDESGVRVDPSAAAQVFYGDSDPAVADALVARLRPMPLDAPVPTVGEPAWHSISATYVVCTNDQALPVTSQRTMAARAETILEWPTDHSPFVTRPADVAGLAADYVG